MFMGRNDDIIYACGGASSTSSKSSATTIILGINIRFGAPPVSSKIFALATISYVSCPVQIFIYSGMETIESELRPLHLKCE